MRTNPTIAWAAWATPGQGPEFCFINRRRRPVWLARLARRLGRGDDTERGQSW